jgi:hypothetical protein
MRLLTRLDGTEKENENEGRGTGSRVLTFLLLAQPYKISKKKSKFQARKI